MAITVEPVVVIPDMLSKNASLIEKSKLANMKGIEPNIAIDNQAKVEKRKVCFKFSRYSFCMFARTNKEPIRTVTNEEDKKL